MCNCIETVNDQLRPHNTRLVTTHRITDGALIGTMEIRTERIVNYRDCKLPMLVTPAFCPMCGEKIKDAA